MKNTYRVEGDSVYITLNRKKYESVETIISLEDLPRLLELNCVIYVNDKGHTLYADIAFIPHKTDNSNRFKLHRYLLSPPKELQVDHINHNTLDNRRSNLRIVTQSQNMQNLDPNRVRNKTGYRGVYENRNGKYIGLSKVDKKNYYVGTFDTPEQAADAVSNFRAICQPYSKDAREIKNPELPKTRATPRNQTSGIKGISWSKSSHKWRIYLRVNKKTVHGGFYTTLDEAISALEKMKRNET